MGWIELGTLSLNHNWQIIDVEIGDVELFRIRQSWIIQPVGKALIAQAYNTPNDYYDLQGFYPSQERKIKKLEVPKAFLLSNLVTRRIALKMGFYAKSLDNSWQITVDYWDAFSNP